MEDQEVIVAAPQPAATPALNEADRILSSLVAKTTFSALPKIIRTTNTRAEELLKQMAGGNAVDSKTLASLLNVCVNEAAHAEIRFDGIRPRDSAPQEPNVNEIQVELIFMVTRKIQIFDVFAGENIYRIPYPVFHPINFKIVVFAKLAACKIQYLSISLRRPDDQQLRWVHVFHGEMGNLCLGTLGTTFTNIGLDGTFLAKLLSSLECANLNSPARSFNNEPERFEPEYSQLCHDCCTYAEQTQEQRNAHEYKKLIYSTWRVISTIQRD
jgi:hypothetical protein